MRVFVWIVTSLFCGAGVGAYTVHIVWQQRIEAGKQAEIVRIEAEKEAERERVEAEIFTNAEAEVFIKMMRRFEEIINESYYLLHNKNDWDAFANYVYSTVDVMESTVRESFGMYERKLIDVGSKVYGQENQKITTAYYSGYNDGITVGFQQGIQYSQSYSQQPTQPSQDYVQQTTQQNTLTSVQSNSGNWSVYTNSGQYVTSGRAFKTAGDWYNVQSYSGNWSVYDSNGKYIISGRAEKTSGNHYNVQSNSGNWSVYDSNGRYVTSGRME